MAWYKGMCIRHDGRFSFIERKLREKYMNHKDYTCLMGIFVIFFAGFMTAVFLVNGVFAVSIVDDLQNAPLTNTTIFLLFLIVVILVALVLKYTHKRSDVERIREELEEEEAERDFDES